MSLIKIKKLLTDLTEEFPLEETKAIHSITLTDKCETGIRITLVINNKFHDVYFVNEDLEKDLEDIKTEIVDLMKNKQYE